jgi:hypothetical protein
MGLWSSKQTKNVTVTNPEPTSGQIYVTDDAVKTMINTLESSKEKSATIKTSKSTDGTNKSTSTNQDHLDLRLSPDMRDKRISEYEHNLMDGFSKSSLEVENLFKERYKTFPVCFELQKSITQCYNENPKQTLKCLDISNQFLK